MENKKRQVNRFYRFAIVIIVFFFVIGCTSYKNLTYHKDYAHFVDKIYKTRKNLWIDGKHTRESNKLSHFSLTRFNVFLHTRFTVLFDNIPIGSTFKIIKISGCTNCTGGFQIKFLSIDKYSEFPVRIIYSDFVKVIDNIVFLNDEYFEPIEEERH